LPTVTPSARAALQALAAELGGDVLQPGAGLDPGRHSMEDALVPGLEAVLADGTVLSSPGKVRPDAAGDA
jgi:hypothetical protein